MSKPRFDRLDEEKRARLLRCAANEFADKGFEGASLNQILECAGMSKSSLYYYFDDKADLFSTLLERAVSGMVAEMGPFDLQALTPENFWQSCESFYDRGVKLIAQQSSSIKLGQIFYHLRAEPSTSQATEKMMAAAREWLEAFVRRGQLLNTIRTDLPDTLLMETFVAVALTLDRWIVENWERMAPTARENLAREHIDLMKRLLAP